MLDPQELYVDSIACRFGNRMVLSGVFVNCKPGEVVGLLGRNGAGKSTLLKIIFGTLKGYYKYCKLNGKRFTKGYQTGNIAYLPQQSLMPGSTKVAWAVDMLTQNYRAELLQNDFIQRHLEARIDTLAGGERRMIEALLILYSDAQYVLLDEPFSNVEPFYIDELHQHIQRLKPEKGFIITDHYYERILEISDRIVLIHNGCNYRIDSHEDLCLYGYIPASAFE